MISTLDNTDTETISAFVFIDSLVISVSQDAGGYAIFRQNNLELHLGYHTFWLSYFTLVMWSIYEIIHFWIFFLHWYTSVADVRADVRSRDYQNFSDK